MIWNKICKIYFSSLFEKDKIIYRLQDIETKIIENSDFKIEV